MQLKDLITVAPRFTRSINLERDAATPEAIDGYIVTTVGQEFLGRIARSLTAPAGHRAWTITGTYGSGKSALALYIANLLGPASTEGGRIARSILREQQPELYHTLFSGGAKARLTKEGLCPVLISGAPESLLGALLRACCRDLRRFYSTGGKPPNALRELEALRDAFRSGQEVSPTEVVETLTRLIQNLRETGRARGVVLIIDELGKFLEYAARDPERGDIYILQQLAEATARFNPPSFLVITILHQAFEQYVTELRPGVRAEWSKVQGRFEDFAFQEPPEQLLSLMGAAIRQSDHRALKPLKAQARAQAKQAIALGLLPRGMAKADFLEAAERCAPLHPLVMFALVRLCRKFGQNQRSLFSFFASRELHGFASFLLQEIGRESVPCYTLPDLYDYIAEALGAGLGVGEGATRWAEVQTALERAASASREEINLIKAIGLLSAIGAYGELKPSTEVLRFGSMARPRDFNKAYRSILTSSLAVERKHSETVALWEGSDIDIRERMAEADRCLPQGASLAQKVNDLWSPQPIVAKRHSFETGTLRYFAVRFADITNFSKGLEVPDDADGLLLYCLPGSKAEFEHLLEMAQESEVRERPEVLVAVAQEVIGLSEVIRELELLRWVENNTPELQGDRVARREIRSLKAVVESRIASELRRLFSPNHHTVSNTQWFHNGIRQPINNTRTLAAFLTHVCGIVYPHTPALRNELINRRQLSSAASAARRVLIDRMLKNGDEERLGIIGTPPELSIYASVLENTGVHRREEDGYVFGAPKVDAGLEAVWREIKDFFAHCELQRRSVRELFEKLRRPPYGLKSGVIPIIFCAAAIAHDTEVAFYENDAFLPEVTIETYERLMHTPEKFELRHYRVEGVRREVFRQMAQLFGKDIEHGKQNIVGIMRPLYRFFNRLPVYTRQTQNLSPVAIAVRECLFASKDPDALLFSQLPRACGTTDFTITKASADNVGVFFKTFKAALAELQRAYDDLLADLQSILFKAHNLAGESARELLASRARNISEHCVDPRLKAFVFNLQDDQPEAGLWIETVATMIVGKEPRSWGDLDRARYEVALADLVRNFRHIESLVFEGAKRLVNGFDPAQIVRIGVSDRYSKEVEAVAFVEKKDQGRFAEAILKVRSSLDELEISDNPELALAALATVAKDFLSELTEDTQGKVRRKVSRKAVEVSRGK